MQMMDRKIQMMDAGTALFEMEGGFGTALGQVRAELKEFGRVYDDEEDLVLDFSDIWMKRVITCHLEGAGDVGDRHRYAAVFKEGSASTMLRALVHGTMITVLAFVLFFPGILFPELASLWLSVICIVGIAAVAYNWITPSRKSVKTLKKISEKVSNTRF